LTSGRHARLALLIGLVRVTVRFRADCGPFGVRS
jgi:hypothetical protein